MCVYQHVIPPTGYDCCPSLLRIIWRHWISMDVTIKLALTLNHSQFCHWNTKSDTKQNTTFTPVCFRDVRHHKKEHYQYSQNQNMINLRDQFLGFSKEDIECMNQLSPHSPSEFFEREAGAFPSCRCSTWALESSLTTFKLIKYCCTVLNSIICSKQCDKSHTIIRETLILLVQIQDRS